MSQVSLSHLTHSLFSLFSSGTDEMIDMNHFARLVMSFEGKDLPIKNIPGPEGVRGRNSDNTLIKEKLGWAPSISLYDGIKVKCLCV